MDRIRKMLSVSLLVAFFAPFSLPAAEQWVKLATPNFELYTTAGEKRGRQAILHFEQVRSFFLKVGIKDPGGSDRVRIMAFQSAKEYELYRPNEFAFAYYLGGFNKDYIVMQSLGADTYPVAIHEYVHLLVRHSGIELPVWLNEGLADLYSTLEPVAKKVKVGLMIPGRLAVMERKKMLDLETLMSVDQNSPYYNERNRADIFYAESWALVHMLQLSDGYRPRYPEFVRALTAGGSPAVVFQKIYGKSLTQVQKELEGYIRANSYMVAYFDTQLEKASENPQMQPAPPVEVGLIQVDLLNGRRQEQQATALLAKLAQENPNSPEIAEAQGYLAWKSHQSMEDVEALFEKAVKLGSTNPRLYYDFGRMQGADRHDAAAVPLFQKALDLQPDYKDARLALANALYNERQYGQAVAALGLVHEVSREEGLRFYRLLAYAYHGLRQDENARKSAEKLLEISETTEEIALAKDLMRYISQAPLPNQPASAGISSTPNPAAAPGSAEIPPGPPDAGTRPRLQRRSVPESTVTEQVAPWPLTVTIEGTLFQFDCLGEVARLTVLYGGRRVSFAILDPTAVTIRGSKSGTLDFSCGRQQPIPVVIEFEDKVDGKLGTTGVVKAIEFK